MSIPTVHFYSGHITLDYIALSGDPFRFSFDDPREIKPQIYRLPTFADGFTDADAEFVVRFIDGLSNEVQA